MDVLRQELESVYAAQNLSYEALDGNVVRQVCSLVNNAAAVESDCRVITDVAADKCYIYGGELVSMLGLKAVQSTRADAPIYLKEVDTSDEDEIYRLIHPADLVDKRMLEYEFFKYVDTLTVPFKLHYRATCRIRIHDREGRYVYVDNSTRVVRLSPRGKMWLIMCTYALSPFQEFTEDIYPRIVNTVLGEVKLLSFVKRRSSILTAREKEILSLIRNGKPSKQIADKLGISVHTVNRHRQNILEKLCVGNSVEAVKAATEMRLL